MQCFFMRETKVLIKQCNAQAAFGLHCTHMPEGTFSHVTLYTEWFKCSLANYSAYEETQSNQASDFRGFV